MDTTLRAIARTAEAAANDDVIDIVPNAADLLRDEDPDVHGEIDRAYLDDDTDRMLEIERAALVGHIAGLTGRDFSEVAAFIDGAES